MSTTTPGFPIPPSPPDQPGWQPPLDFADEEADDQPGFSIRRYLSAVIRYKWLILGLTIVGSAAGIVLSQMSTPIYSTQTTLWVEVGNPRMAQSGPIRPAQLLESTAWLDLLRSYTVLDSVVIERRLYLGARHEDREAFSTFALGESFQTGSYRLVVDPEGKSFVLTTADGAEVQRGRVGDPIGAAVGFDWVPPTGQLKPNRTIEFSVRNPHQVAIGLSQRIVPNMDREGNFIRLSMSGPDPEEITATLNAVASRYVRIAAELKRAKLDELTAILEEQRRYAEDNLRQAEMDLESFRVNTITLPTDQSTPVAAGLEITRDPVFSRFFDLRVRHEDLRQDREAILRVLEQLKRNEVTVEALGLIPSVQASPSLSAALTERTNLRAELRALLQRYTPEHRSVRDLTERVMALETQTIPTLAAALAAELGEQQRDLDGQIATASTELRQIPPRSIEEARLERRVAIAENLYTTLRQRYEEARLAAVSSIPDVRVLDEAAVPTAPTSDNRTMLMLLGFAGSLGLGLGLALVLDRFDPKVRYPEQVTHEIGLPILSALPEVRRSGSKKDESQAQVTEALRELRLNVMHAAGAAGPLTLTITSPESGDGKSFVASNLAACFAEQGYRTLLIDGDIRRGALHRSFETVRTPGLTDYLAQRATFEEILHPTRLPMVQLITAGTRMAAGPELLGSRSMSELMARARAQFDVILVDSPPLGAGIDPYVLGTVTRDLLLVLRTGSTNRAFTEAKLAPLSRLPVRILGVALNGTPSTDVYRYYSYLPGYTAEEEEVPGALPVLTS